MRSKVELRLILAVWLGGSLMLLSGCAAAPEPETKASPEAVRMATEAYHRGHYNFAFRAFKREAERGNARGQFSLGHLYHTGLGVERNMDKAIHWYRKAAEAGVPTASFNLGVIHAAGEGVEADPVQAVKFYQAAAEGGYVRAYTNLGVMYRDGHGVPKDPQLAFRHFDRAAQFGEPIAQYELAMIYGNGTGVERDHEMAYALFLMAMERNIDGAAENWLEAHMALPVPRQDAARELAWKLQEVVLKNTGGRVPAPQRDGAEIYERHCFACHGRASYDAPQFGDAKAWWPRVANGMDVLVRHTVEGFSDMPKRGLCITCTAPELHAAILYMLPPELRGAAEQGRDSNHAK